MKKLPIAELTDILEDLADIQHAAQGKGVYVQMIFRTDSRTGLREGGVLTGSCPHCAAKMFYDAADTLAAREDGCGAIEIKVSRRDLRHEDR